MTNQMDDSSPDVWDEQDEIQPPQKHWWSCLGSVVRPWRNQHTKQMEWMGYYNAMYKSQGPSVKIFKSLLLRNGYFYVPNPYVDGNPNFYNYCQDGITLADIDFVLGRWEEKFAPKHNTDRDRSTQGFVPDKRKSSEIKVQDLIARISQNWETVYLHRPQQLQGQSITMTEENNRKTWIKTQQKWEREAILSLIVLFKSSIKNWRWISEIVHHDNIRLLCKIVYDGAPQSDRPVLLKQWKKVNWVTEASQKWFK